MLRDWAQPKWWWLLVAGCGVLVYSCDKYQDWKRDQRAQSQRREDQARDEARIANEKASEDQKRLEEELQAKPYLKYVNGDGPRADGFTHLKYHNTSTSRNAIITFIELWIDDPKQLQVIETYYPKPDAIQAGAKYDKNELRLVRGIWSGDAYTFYVYPDFYIDPDGVTEMVTCIVDSKLPVMNFVGRLVITLDEGDAQGLKTVTLRSRKK